MSRDSHIVSSFDDDLNQIETLLLEMGALVENQIENAARSLIRRDVEIGEKVIITDKAIDNLEFEIDNCTVRILALRSPKAQDLRMVVIAPKIAANLERIGDYCKNIAKRVNVLVNGRQLGSADITIESMNDFVQEMVHDVLDALKRRDQDKATDVWLRDRNVDQMHNTLFRELLTHMMEDPRSISDCMHLLFIAKNIERMGDHATSIAEKVYYFVSGKMLEDERPKSDTTSSTTIDSDEADELKCD